MKLLLLTLVILLISTFFGHSQQHSLNFDGVDDYVDISSIASTMAGLDEFSFEMWINPNPNQILPYGNLLSSNSNIDQLHRFVFRLSGPEDAVANTVVLNIPGGGTYHKIIGTKNVMDTACHHVAWTYDNGLSKLYIDGELQGQLNYQLTFSETDKFSLGQEFDLPVYTPSDFYKGDIDEFRIWNHAISETQINTLMGTEISLSETGLLGYFQFNQGVANDDNSTQTVLINIKAPAQSGTLVNFTLAGSESNFVNSECRGLVVGLSDNTTQEVIQIYPNPSNGIINIESSFEGQLSVLIFNLQGEVVLGQKVDNNYRQVDVSNLSNGTYILSVNDYSTSTIARKRFILTH